MKKTLLLILAAGALLLAACGSDDDASDSNGGGVYDSGSSDATEPTDTGTDTAPAGDAIVSTGSTDLGEVLVTSAGLSLYGFTPDEEAGAPTCTDGCADAWPPMLIDGDELPEGLDPAVFSIVEHPSGENQLQAGDYPLYLFAGDAAPGDTNGQGSGGSWFLVAPDGSLIE